MAEPAPTPPPAAVAAGLRSLLGNRTSLAPAVTGRPPTVYTFSYYSVLYARIRGFLQRSPSAPVCAAARGCSGSACDVFGCAGLVFIGVPTYKETRKLSDALFWAFSLASSSRCTAVHSPASLIARRDDFSTSVFWLTSAALTEYTGSST